MYFTINNTTQDKSNRRFNEGYSRNEVELLVRNGITVEELKDRGISLRTIERARRTVEKDEEKASSHHSVDSSNGWFVKKDMSNNIPIGKDAVQAEKDRHAKEPESNKDFCKRYVDSLNS